MIFSLPALLALTLTEFVTILSEIVLSKIGLKLAKSYRKIRLYLQLFREKPEKLETTLQKQINSTERSIP